MEGEGAVVFGCQEVKPPARGSGQTRGPAPAREQIETVSQGMRATRLLTELRGAHWNQAETGSCRSMQGLLAASSARNAKDRDALALEVRAGTPGVGHTSQDAAGLSSTNRNRVKVARTSVENCPRSLCSETEDEIRPLLL